MAMHRRDVLKALTAGIGLASASMFCNRRDACASRLAVGDVRRHIRRALGATFIEDLSPQMIGRAYLSLYPEEADIDHLMAKLAGTRVQPRLDELEARLVQLRQWDFEDGEITIVGGWILARTEARACALLILL